MRGRPYFRHSGNELHQIFYDNQNDLGVLEQLFAELKHRKTPKMKKLRSDTEKKDRGA